MNVIPSWRGQGIVSALLVHTMLRFLAAGMERAALAVDTQNPTGALSLNENLGFMAVKRNNQLYKSGEFRRLITAAEVKCVFPMLETAS